MKKFFIILNIILTLIIIFFAGFLVGKKYDLTVDENDKLVGVAYSANEQKIRRLMSLIDKQYVDDVNSDSLIDNAISYVLSNLDPHTTYLDKKTLQRVSEEMDGTYVGIGIQYQIIEDTVVVSQVLKNSPNYNNLLFGDKILRVNNQSVVGKSSEIIETLFKGEKATEVKVEIKRFNQIKNLTIKRGNVSIKSVIASHMINSKVGYIKLLRFAEHSAEEVHQALVELKSKGMQSLILDLRGNPGGIMTVAEAIADEFLKNKELIVYTQDRDEKRKYIYATSKGEFENGNVYVLIDESSASASEIVAGALQEYGRGTIIGRRSFGKGLVQRELSLGDGTRIRLTVARYFTPSGRSIQRPYTDGKEAYSDEIYERVNNGELYNKDSIKVNKTLKHKAPSGKIVYGGGGIVPDEFVSIDTLKISKWLYKYSGSSTTQNFILNQIKNNQYHPLFANPELFIKYYDITDAYLDFFDILGTKPEYLDEASKNYLKNYLKAAIVGQVFGNEAFYKVWNNEDSMIKRALILEDITQ